MFHVTCPFISLRAEALRAEGVGTRGSASSAQAPSAQGPELRSQDCTGGVHACALSFLSLQRFDICTVAIPGTAGWRWAAVRFVFRIFSHDAQPALDNQPYITMADFRAASVSSMGSEAPIEVRVSHGCVSRPNEALSALMRPRIALAQDVHQQDIPSLAERMRRELYVKDRQGSTPQSWGLLAHGGAFGHAHAMQPRGCATAHALTTAA